jgi:hypothetical protein
VTRERTPVRRTPDGEYTARREPTAVLAAADRAARWSSPRLQGVNRPPQWLLPTVLTALVLIVVVGAFLR